MPSSPTRELRHFVRTRRVAFRFGMHALAADGQHVDACTANAGRLHAAVTEVAADTAASAASAAIRLVVDPPRAPARSK